jgi:hypothetical protein
MGSRLGELTAGAESSLEGREWYCVRLQSLLGFRSGYCTRGGGFAGAADRSTSPFWGKTLTHYPKHEAAFTMKRMRNVQNVT